MKNRRAILILLLIIVALVAVTVAFHPFAVPVTVNSRVTLLEKGGAVRRLTIARRGGTPPTELRYAEGWRMMSPYAASVEEARVLKLLDALAFTPITDSYTDANLLKLGRTRGDFALETPPIVVTVIRDDEKKTSLSFGSPTPTGDGLYAAVEGVDAVFVVPPSVLAAVDLPPESFRRRSLFPVGTEAPSSFDIKRGTGALLTFARTTDGWKSEGEAAFSQKVSAQKVKEYLDRLLSTDAVDFVWPVGATNETVQASASLLSGYELDPESAVTVTLKGASGSNRQISFGKIAGEGHVYALVENGGAIVTVPAELRETAVKAGVLFTDARLFPVEKSAVLAFTLSDKAVTCALARGEKEGWRLESPISAPADSVFVEATLDRILTLAPADLVPTGIHVSLGTNLSATVAAARLFGEGDLTVFRSKEVLSVEPTLVRRLVQTPGEQGARAATVAYNRERQAWGLESETDAGKVDVEAVTAVLKTLSSLTALRVVKLKAEAADLANYGLDTPSFTLAVDQERENAVRRNILIGTETEGGFYATVGSSDAVFVLSGETVERLKHPFVIRP